MHRNSRLSLVWMLLLWACDDPAFLRPPSPRASGESAGQSTGGVASSATGGQGSGGASLAGGGQGGTAGQHAGGSLAGTGGHAAGGCQVGTTDACSVCWDGGLSCYVNTCNSEMHFSSCAPYQCGSWDAVVTGDCSTALGFAWNGSACVALVGCECVGADCARSAFAGACEHNEQACREACDGSPCGSQCSMGDASPHAGNTSPSHGVCDALGVCAPGEVTCAAGGASGAGSGGWGGGG